MDENEIITIDVPPLVCACVRCAISEIGGSIDTKFALEFLGIKDDEWKKLSEQFIGKPSTGSAAVKLPRKDFRKICDIINFVVLEIGSGLITYTFHHLAELMTASRYIYVHTYNRKYRNDYWVKDLVNGEPPR